MKNKVVKISEKLKEKIMKKDPHPYFTEYVLIHSGLAQPKLIGESISKPILWTKTAVQSFYNKIKTQLNAFFKHNADNATKNRKVYGTLIEKRIDKLENGELAVIGVFYHTQSQKKDVEFLDIISHEGEWEFEEINGQLVAKDVREITGFALGNSKDNKPAFEKAEKLASVQCMEVETLPEQKIYIKEEKPMTLSEVTKFIKEQGIQPSKIFSMDEVKQDVLFNKNFQEIENTINSVKTEKDKLEKIKEELEKSIKETKNKLNTYELPNLFNEVVNKNKITMTEKEKVFIEKSLTKFKDEINEDNLKNFINNKQEDYRLFQQLNDVNDNKDDVLMPLSGQDTQDGKKEDIFNFN